MKAVTPFHQGPRLLVVTAWAWGPYGRLPMRLALDTGAAATIIRPETMDALGYDVKDGVAIAGVVTALGEAQGYRQKISRFSALDFDALNFPVHVMDLHEAHKIDGLLGLSFLHKLNYEIRSAERRVFAESIAA